MKFFLTILTVSLFSFLSVVSAAVNTDIFGIYLSDLDNIFNELEMPDRDFNFLDSEPVWPGDENEIFIDDLPNENPIIKEQPKKIDNKSIVDNSTPNQEQKPLKQPEKINNKVIIDKSPYNQEHKIFKPAIEIPEVMEVRGFEDLVAKLKDGVINLTGSGEKILEINLELNSGFDFIEHNGEVTIKLLEILEIKKDSKISLKIKIDNNNVSIKANGEKSDNIILNDSGLEVEVLNDMTFDLNNGNLFIGKNEIKVSPEKIVQKVKERVGAKNSLINSDLKIDLWEYGGKTIYEIKAKKRAKLFGLFDVKVNIDSKIDSETGNIIEISESWWSFLTI